MVFGFFKNKHTTDEQEKNLYKYLSDLGPCGRSEKQNKILEQLREKKLEERLQQEKEAAIFDYENISKERLEELRDIFGGSLGDKILRKEETYQDFEKYFGNLAKNANRRVKRRCKDKGFTDTRISFLLIEEMVKTYDSFCEKYTMYRKYYGMAARWCLQGNNYVPFGYFLKEKKNRFYFESNKFGKDLKQIYLYFFNKYGDSKSEFESWDEKSFELMQKTLLILEDVPLNQIEDYLEEIDIFILDTKINADQFLKYVKQYHRLKGFKR